MLYSEGAMPTLTIYVDVRSTSAFTQGYAFFNDNGGISDIPFNDFWVNIGLYKTHELIDYVDIKKDERIQKIERQEINPFYLEYAFFDDVSRNKVNNGSQLTDVMVNFILSKRSDLHEMTNQQVREWYDYTGKNELPWITADGSKVTVDDIEVSHPILTSLVSKAKLLGIDIQK